MLATPAGEVRLLAPRDRARLAGDEAIIASLPAGAARVLNVLARPGFGVTDAAARFAFALADCPALGLARWSAMVLDPPEPVRGDLVALGDLPPAARGG